MHPCTHAHMHTHRHEIEVCAQSHRKRSHPIEYDKKKTTVTFDTSANCLLIKSPNNQKKHERNLSRTHITHTTHHTTAQHTRNDRGGAVPARAATTHCRIASNSVGAAAQPSCLASCTRTHSHHKHSHSHSQRPSHPKQVFSRVAGSTPRGTCPSQCTSDNGARHVHSSTAQQGTWPYYHRAPATTPCCPSPSSHRRRHHHHRHHHHRHHHQSRQQHCCDFIFTPSPSPSCC